MISVGGRSSASNDPTNKGLNVMILTGVGVITSSGLDPDSSSSSSIGWGHVPQDGPLGHTCWLKNSWIVGSFGLLRLSLDSPKSCWRDSSFSLIILASARASVWNRV